MVTVEAAIWESMNWCGGFRLEVEGHFAEKVTQSCITEAYTSRLCIHLLSVDATLLRGRSGLYL